MAPPGATAVHISAPPLVPAAPPVDAAFMFFRARRVHVAAVPVFVTEVREVSVVAVGLLAPNMRSSSAPAGGVKDDDVMLRVFVLENAGGVVASMASATTPPRLRR